MADEIREMMDEVITIFGQMNDVKMRLKPLLMEKKALNQEMKQRIADIVEQLNAPVVYRGFTFGAETKEKVQYTKKNVTSFLSQEQNQAFAQQYTEVHMKPVFKKPKNK